MHPDVVVRTTDATVTYGSGGAARSALKLASLDVLDDDRIALVGVSGSGKSTLLHVLGGLIGLTSGSVEWPAISNPRSPAGGIGTVFQAPSLISALTVVENVELPLLLAGAARADARYRADDALEALRLESFATRLPEELSGGQAQRVAVARVLASGARLILADEPTGQLDVENGALVIDALLHTADEHGAALLVATHDPRVSERLTRTIRVTDGVLQPVPAFTDEVKQ